MIDDIDIKVGRTYPIKHVIEELKRHPDIRLGHILALNRHEYHSGVVELEALQKRMDRAEIGGEEIVYDMSGKKRIGTHDIVVLSIMDPYTKYVRYEKFYEELYEKISDAIDKVTSGVVMTRSEDIIKEVRNEGFSVEKEDDVFDGICIFFTRKGIESRRILKEKDGKRREYVIFGREGTITKEEQDRSIGDKEKEKLPSIGEREAIEIKEKTKEFEQSYRELEKDIIPFITQKKVGGAINIDQIISEVKKIIPNIENRKDIFIKGMILFFKEKGVSTEIMKKENLIIFKMI